MIPSFEPASNNNNNDNNSNNNKLSSGNICPGSSTHTKVVFREVLHVVELKFENVAFWGEGKTRESREKPLGEE